MSKQLTITIKDDGTFDWSTDGLDIPTIIMLLEAVKLSILNGEFTPMEEES